MAQREKEETEFNVPETLRCLKPAGIIPPAVISGHDPPKQRSPRSPRKRQLQESEKDAPSDALEKLPSPLIRQSNRCSGCKRKVGLIGFRCRCGNLFCAEHRYSDRHSCSFDYKAAGKEAIERENPVIKAAKIVRI